MATNKNLLPPGVKKREIPDPVAFMQARMGGGVEGSPAEEAGESPSVEAQEQAFGIDKPTQGDPAKTGFQSVNSHGKAQAGRSEPSSQFRGNGAKQAPLAPNNTKKAGTTTKGKTPFGMPSRNAIARRLNAPAGHATVGPSKADSAKRAKGRTGNLKKFEGFNKKVGN